MGSVRFTYIAISKNVVRENDECQLSNFSAIARLKRSVGIEY